MVSLDELIQQLQQAKEPVEAYDNGHEIVVCGLPDPNDEDHNCDALGCSSVSHVLYRFIKQGRVSDTLSSGGRVTANPEHESATSQTSEHSSRPAPTAAPVVEGVQDDNDLRCAGCGADFKTAQLPLHEHRWVKREQPSTPTPGAGAREVTWFKQVPMKDQWFISGYYFQRRLSNHALQVVHVNQHGVSWATGKSAAIWLSDLHATGDYEWLGPITPEVVAAHYPPTEATVAGEKSVSSAVHELVERWFTGDLPDRAKIFSSLPQQLRVLAQEVISKHCTTIPAANEEVERLRSEIARAMAIPQPNMPESGLEDACRQLKQAYVSERDNAETADKLLTEAQVELAEYEGIEGRCPNGHNKKFTYDLNGSVGCVVCEKDEARANAIGECVDAIPKNWLDSLLTGPDAALPKETYVYSGEDIERLLEGIKQRLESLTRPQAGGETDEPEDPSRDPMALWQHGISDADLD
jgi:hypothetical protein